MNLTDEQIAKMNDALKKLVEAGFSVQEVVYGMRSILNGDAPVDPPPPDMPHCRYGINIDEASYYSQIIPWANVARQAKPWHSGTETTWNDKRELDLNEYGMPRSLEDGQVARTLLNRNGGAYPGGIYDIHPPMGSSIVPRFDAAEDSNERIIATPSNDGMCFELRKPITSQDDRIWLWHAETNPAAQVNPAFLSLLKPFGVLRTMDLQRTNGSPITCLEDYVSYDNWTWDVPGGPPIRALCELCNAANCALWFCLPHLALEDAYNMADEIKTYLAEHLPVYVEYSNEIWNGGFAQSDWVLTSAKKLGFPGDNDSQKRAHLYSRTVVEMIKEFKDALGSDRVIGVMASQAANAGLSRRLLEYQGAHEVVDALAIAPYFGGELGQADRIAKVRGYSENTLYAELCSRSIPLAASHMVMQKAIADEFGVELIAYEGGQHLRASSVTSNDPINVLFDAMNRSEAMELAYELYHDAWDDVGGGTFCHYSLCRAPSQYGRWGLVESMLQDPETAPKYRAVKAWAEK